MAGNRTRNHVFRQVPASRNVRLKRWKGYMLKTIQPPTGLSQGADCCCMFSLSYFALFQRGSEVSPSVTIAGNAGPISLECVSTSATFLEVFSAPMDLLDTTSAVGLAFV